MTIKRSVRVAQLEGLFDVPPAERAEQSWQVKLPLPPSWNVGLIVGPSGCGKSTIAREFWPEHLVDAWQWPADASLLDGFPSAMGIKDITGLLSAVGFSAPPSWMKPFGVLSNGEQFRVNIARTLAEHPELAVVDEFTSVVDRDVAKIASAAIAKAVRRLDQKFVALSCHYDVAEWLEPDWLYQPHTGEFFAGRSLRRPSLELEIVRVHTSAWRLFKDTHYLSGNIHRGAACFVALVWGRPAAFCSVVSFPHAIRPGWREHRTVCLPDFQGVGIGSALGEYVASLYAATGKPYRSTTSNPAYIAHRRRSPLWRTIREPSLCHALWSGNRRCDMSKTTSWNRFTAGFEYVGAANAEDARRFGVLNPNRAASGQDRKLERRARQTILASRGKG